MKETETSARFTIFASVLVVASTFAGATKDEARLQRTNLLARS